MPFTVADLRDERSEPVAVSPDTLLQDALDVMREHDFSQLPVVQGERLPIGMVTSDSIVRVMSHFNTSLSTPRVLNATVRKPEEYQLDDNLFDLFDSLRDNYSALIVDSSGRLTGIVTSYDATEFFRRRHQDLMHIEDIESVLKDLIRDGLTGEDGQPDEGALNDFIRSATDPRREDRKVTQQMLRRYLAAVGETAQFNESAFEDAFNKCYPEPKPRLLEELTLAEYIHLLLHESQWNHFGKNLGLEREAVRHMLNGVRESRNVLAHFRRPLTISERDRLRFCSEWLSRIQESISKAPSKATTLPHAGPPALNSEVVETNAEVVEPEDSKYALLALFLKEKPPSEVAVELSFVRIEEIIRGGLPASAREHRAWWANDTTGHVQSRQWLDVGWRVSTVNIAEERVTFVRVHGREQLYIRFFGDLLAELRAQARFTLRSSPLTGTSWIWIAGVPQSGPHLAYLSFSFALRSRFRVELYIDSGDHEQNKRVFDALHEQRQTIEAELGTAPQWERLDDKRASRVAVYRPGSITDDETHLAKLKDWAVGTMLRFQKVIDSRIRGA